MTAKQTADGPEVLLYTDGACSGNPGPGGWAFILHSVPTRKRKEASGAEPHTTNNRMELQAVIEGLKCLTRPCRVRVITDSRYVADGVRSWMPAWKANGWRRREGRKFKPVKNEELWRELDALVGEHEVAFEVVRGHTGHPENERCDQLAVRAYRALQ